MSAREVSPRPLSPPSIGRHCIKCGSQHVHHSRPRRRIERWFDLAGGEICRCHGCGTRQVWFGRFSFRLGDGEVAGPIESLAIVISGTAAVMLVAWLFLRLR
jgi:hypothetical protein